MKKYVQLFSVVCALLIGVVTLSPRAMAASDGLYTVLVQSYDPSTKSWDDGIVRSATLAPADALESFCFNASVLNLKDGVKYFVFSNEMTECVVFAMDSHNPNMIKAAQGKKWTVVHDTRGHIWRIRAAAK